MIRAAVDCRWRPAQEGARVIGKIASRRKLRVSLPVLRCLLQRRALPLRALVALSDMGHVSGLDTFWWKGDTNGLPASRDDRTLRAGGLLIGLLHHQREHPENPVPGSGNPSAAPVLPSDWCWVAALMSSNELYVYANEIGLGAIQELVEHHIDSAVEAICGIAALSTHTTLAVPATESDNVS